MKFQYKPKLFAKRFVEIDGLIRLDKSQYIKTKDYRKEAAQMNEDLKEGMKEENKDENKEEPRALLLKAIGENEDEDEVKEAKLSIIERFTPKIKYYAKKLSYEYAETDMIIAMLEIIQTTKAEKVEDRETGQIVNFILSALNNKYMQLVNRQANRIIEETSINTLIIPIYDRYENLEKYNTLLMLKGLSGLQRKIIIAKYVYGYRCTEIAKLTGKSRQAISKQEKRALMLIKKSL